MIRIVDRNNQNLDVAIKNILQNVNSKLQKCGKLISQSLLWTTRNHFKKIYPNSNHYNPNKVVESTNKNGLKSLGSIDINVPGITRAYRNLHITPKNSKRLTIPLHRSAYGKKATEFNDLFFIKKKNGKEFLAKKNSDKGITFMYYLTKQVHQKQDKRLIPSDKTFANNIFSRINVYLNKEVKNG